MSGTDWMGLKMTEYHEWRRAETETITFWISSTWNILWNLYDENVGVHIRWRYSFHKSTDFFFLWSNMIFIYDVTVQTWFILYLCTDQCVNPYACFAHELSLGIVWLEMYMWKLVVCMHTNQRWFRRTVTCISYTSV